MAARLAPGAAVSTPFGKGVVREVRNKGRLLVEVHGRSLVLGDDEVTPNDAPARRARARPRNGDPAGPASGDAPAAPLEVDLHGLTVEEALDRAASALDEALRADRPALRLVHGRSGGRIKSALHRWLEALPGMRGFSLDPKNAGVTVVRL